jgi:hypothetical protein
VIGIKGVRHFQFDLWGVKATGEMFEFLDVHFLERQNHREANAYTLE